MVTYISICLHRETFPGLQANFMKIKRPLFIIALSVLVVIYSINTLPASVLYCSLALFILFTVVHRLTTNRYTPHLVLFLLAALIGAGWFGVFKNNLSHKISALSQYETVTVSGVVTNKDSIGYTNCYHIDLDSVNNENIRNFKVVVYSDEYLEEGDKVISAGKLKNFTARSDYQYNYSKGVFAYFYPEKLEKQPVKGSSTAVFNQIRTVLIDNARKIFSYDTVSTAIAMGLGEKYLLDYSAKEAFASTGISHALVVSGLHIGFITAVLKSLMYLLPIHKKLKNIVLCCFTVRFMAIMGFTPSIIRAGYLIITITLGRTLLVETDNYTVLAIVMLATLAINPYSAVNSSLLLSYTAYFGVIKGAELCTDRNYGKIKSTFITTVFAVLYTTPVMCVIGMDMTLLSPLFNVMLIYVIMVICVLSFFLPLLVSVPFIGLPLAGFVAPVNDICIRFILRFT